MASRQQRHRETLDEHISEVVEKYAPGCPVCDEKMLREEGMFSMIGTRPRMPRAFGSLKCRQCGYVMFFELPGVESEDVEQDG